MKKILFLFLCLFCLNCSNKGTTENNQPQADSEISLANFMIVLISVGSSFGIMVLYNKLKMRDKIVKTTLESNRIREFIKTFLIESTIFQNATNSTSSKSIGSLNQKDFDLLVQQVTEAIKKENPDLFDKEEAKLSSMEHTVDAAAEVPKKRTKFYSVEPRDGVSFNEAGFTDDFIATESVYFIELQNDHLAHFNLVNDVDTMGRAIKYKKELIDMACESNSASIGSKSIVTEKPGVALKDGNKWIIKQKAKIKFV